MINAPVGGIILSAYGLKTYQFSGGPDWLHDHYDVVAKAENNAGRDELMLMLQNLLKERFKLVLDRETHQVQGYVFTGGKLGPNLKQANEGDAFRLSYIPLVGQAVSMSRLAASLSNLLGGPVEDQTGLTGLYSFKADWRPDSGISPGIPGFYDPMLDAIRSQLGMKVETRKVPVEIFIVKHVERPTEN